MSEPTPDTAAARGTDASASTRVVRLLARRRVTLGFIFSALVFWLAAPTGRTLAIGVPIAALGEAVRIWAAGHLHKSREVSASGPYRWLAHPLYAGSSVIGAGVAVASGSVTAAVIIAVYLTTTIAAAIRSEEAHLRSAFGDRYDRYRRAGEVNRTRRFSAAQAIANREYRAVAGLAVALLLLVAKATYNGMFWGAAGQP